MRLAKAIGYPDPVPETAFAFPFAVDGYTVKAQVEAGRLVLRTDLAAGDGDLATLAGYAAGRVLKDEAALAFDRAAGTAFLWQAVPADAGSAEMRKSFEDFARACDWWRARAEELGKPRPEMPELVIRP